MNEGNNAQGIGLSPTGPVARMARKVVAAPHDDPTLPPQLREALRIMGKRGKVVELTAPEQCPECKGRGARVLPNSSAETECYPCEGTGYRKAVDPVAEAESKGVHPTQTIRVIRLLDRSAGAFVEGRREESNELMAQAMKTSADACAGILGGIRLGEVPEPGTPLWLDWAAIQTAHLAELAMDDFERVHICEGGPLDGKVYREAKAFLPVGNMMPSPDGGMTSAWPDSWPANEPRYMPHWDECGEPVRMVWTTPDKAEQVYHRPESIKDYGDAE